MDTTITGRNAGITDRFRTYVEDRATKVEQLSEKALALEVRLCRHHDKLGGSAGADDRVELTLIGPGPVVRAEAGAGDKYAAFDLAYGKLLERLRRAKDRKKIHKGQSKLGSVRSVDHRDFRIGDVQPADAEMLRAIDPATGSIQTPVEAPADAEITGEAPTEEREDYSPVVIRHKVFSSTPMTVDDALYYMELVGHDFYLFIDSETERPSVVYRRKGWDYGVIHLDESADEQQEVATAARAMALRS